MYTRGPILNHAYNPETPPRYVKDGVVRYTTVRGIQQTWAIARPVYTPAPAGTPFYFSDVNRRIRPSGEIVTSGVTRLMLPRPKREMDPSDDNTWQRQYRFTS